MSRRQNILAVIAFFMAVIGIFIITPSGRQKLQNGFLGIISPFLRKGSEWDRVRKEYSIGTKRLAELEVENASLKTEASRLRAENQALRGIEGENLRLKAALGYQNESPFTLVTARVIGRPVTNWWNTLEVDKGSADGLTADMCVLTPEGLVGKVIRAADHVSTVLLITDESCKVAASVEGGKEQGIIRVEVRGERATNSLQPRMTLNFVSKFAALQPGQKVSTSGAGQVYPPGVTIGKIVDFKSRELDGQGIVEPTVDFVTLSDVFVVTGMKGAQVSK